jgi:hypothetical protein
MLLKFIHSGETYDFVVLQAADSNARGNANPAGE